MKLRFFLSGVFLTFLISASPQGFTKDEPYRICANGDMMGSWTMANQIIHIPVKDEDPFYFRYQRYLFEEDKTMKHLTSNQPITAKQRAYQNAAPANRTYDVASDGTLTLKRKNSASVETMLCTYITDNQPDAPAIAPQKGDILLTFSVTPGQPALLLRLLRREKVD
ncbi:MAG: hypothetical protein EXS63_04615 [Candidatus Omnitrophica bacterium]|nr:hypothetical protein [Candidatus Omnitrophota bacterium]